MTITRPVLRYHGGKFILAPWIIANFPAHRIYVEPFGGGASVLLRKGRSYAEVYNDLDGEIVNLFRVLRDPVQARELLRLLALTPYARDEYRLAYEPHADPVEQARRTCLRSFAGFSSGSTSGHLTGFRANSNRSGTTPAHDWANYPATLVGVIERLRGVVIENKDACEVMRQHDGPDTLHYVDPPYPIVARSASAAKHLANNPLYRYEMTDDQHRALADVLHSLRGAVVLSGYGCQLYDTELYPDWRRVTRAALADGAAPRTEVLWLNSRAAAGTPMLDIGAAA